MNAELYKKNPHILSTRWISFENKTGDKGQGGKENQRAKGHASEMIMPHETKELCNISGCGIINRIWMTNSMASSPEMMRALRIDMYWDGAEKPAVSAPLGDFFGVGLGRRTPFESALFSDPEGRSFNCFIPMPFRKNARITLTNDSRAEYSDVFYDISYSLTDQHDEDVFYFHACWNRVIKNKLGEDFEIMPKVTGTGRYLGANIGVTVDRSYGDAWWGEGEVSVFLDGDGKYPTLVGTGTEDYPGSGYGLGLYSHLYQGCTVSDYTNGLHAFYRYHLPDPVYFEKDCLVTILPIGGTIKKKLLDLMESGAVLRPITGSVGMTFVPLLDRPMEIKDASIKDDSWVNFFYEGDWSATAYFYLDSPENGLPLLADYDTRIFDLRTGSKSNGFVGIAE